MFEFFKKKKQPAPKSRRRARVVKVVEKGERGFDAGKNGRLNHSWTSTESHIDQVIFEQLPTLRARSRDQAQNNDYARRFIHLLKENVVGPNGQSFRSEAVDNAGQDDEKARDAIELAYKDFRKKGNFDFHGRLSGLAFENLCMASLAIDGELIVRRHDTGKYMLQYELIEAWRLDVRHNERLSDGGFIRFGIEHDEAGRRRAYHLARQMLSASPYASHLHTKDYERVPADQIIHVFVPEYIGQRRGIPWMSTALQRMGMLNGFEDASLVNARASASKMGIYYQEANQFGEYTGDDDEEGEIIEDLEPGITTIVPPGLKFQSHDPTYPSGEFAVFVKTALRGIASGLLTGYNTLANDAEGINFTSLRHFTLSDREVYKQIQNFIAEELLKPIAEEFIERARHLGLIKIRAKTGVSIPLSRPLENYLPCAFQGRRWPWVDPLKDILSRKEEIKLGVTTPSEIVRESGRDPERVWRELERDIARLEKIGINVLSDSRIDEETLKDIDSEEGESPPGNEKN